MSETASGLARIVSLLMLTAVLALVWRGDQQTQQQFIIARKAAAEQSRELLLADQSTAKQARAMAERSSTATRSAPATDQVAMRGEISYVTRVEVEMVLPAGIAPGSYQVVDQTGQMQRISVATTKLRYQQRDLYVLDLPDGARRFFIRVTDPEEAEPRTASGRGNQPR